MQLDDTQHTPAPSTLAWNRVRLHKKPIKNRHLAIVVISAGGMLPIAYLPDAWAQNTPAVTKEINETVSSAAKSSTATLAPITITGTGGLNATSEGTGSYVPSAITVGSKIPQTIRETPFSVTIITRERLDDQNVTNIQDVLKQTTGMTVTRYDGAGNANSISSRGFSIGSIQLDGLPTSQDTSYTTGLDAAIYDRIEVLRGPAGLLQGAGEPGGTINLVRKRAQPGFAGNVGLMLGSWDTKRASVDVTSSLVESGRIRARVVGVIDKRNSYVDIVKNDKTVGYGTLEFDLTPDTTFSLGAARQNLDTVRDLGLPTYADGSLLDISRSTFAGRSANTQRQETSQMFAELEHHLDNGGLLKLAAREGKRYSSDYGVRASSPVNPLTGEVKMQGAASRRQTIDTNFDAFLSTPFELGGHTQRALLGLSHSIKETKRASAPNSNAGGMLNIFDPDYNVAIPDMDIGPYSSESTLTETGLYGQLQLKPVDRWTFLLGGRMSWWDSESRNLLTGVVTPIPNSSPKFTPMAGVIFDLNGHSSLYASYAQTFVPQTNLDINGTVLPPRTGSQMEMGIKSEFFDKRLITHLAAFRILDKNRAMADPDDITGNSAIAGGEVRAQGWEAEISGEIRPGLELIAGYAYTNTKYLKAPSNQRGQVFSAVTPKHSANLWIKKTWQDGMLRRVSLAAGLRSVSSFYAESGGVRIHGSGYTVVNGQIGYQFNKTTHASLMVNNLLDKKYYEKVSGTSRQNFYGEPRNVMLTFRTAW
ncbi:TonB-dependent siderophore receptor [Allopusillimonas ginsengisoli]|uniref:TonB-dependent siderophore receptor n=1 Tax=Allopusillimonas ginsengisoli TaxID=453575 RepID=UPI0010C21E0B|nr:TonB-dependent siderophore receptor [Allopusillimonas ginsengisoli]